MREIQSWAARLEEKDKRYSRFAGKVGKLAGGFKAKAILGLAEQLAGKGR